MNRILLCPECSEVLIKSHGEELKVRGKVLIVNDKGAFTVCRRCDNEVAVPLRLDADMMKSLDIERPRLYVPVKKSS